jgi:hypothetical protein
VYPFDPHTFENTTISAQVWGKGRPPKSNGVFVGLQDLSWAHVKSQSLTTTPSGRMSKDPRGGEEKKKEKKEK